MLDNLSENIRHCHRKAEECRRLAQTAQSNDERAKWLDLERNWLALAMSFDITERLARFDPQ
jgi:hypothetical protein